MKERVSLFYVCYGEYTGKRTIAAFMRYFRAKEAEEAQNAAFRLYIGTGMQFTVEHLAHLVGGHILVDYVEFMGLKPKDTRSSDEIAADIIKGAGLVL